MIRTRLVEVAPEAQRRPDVGDDGAPRLLCRRDGHSPPPVRSGRAKQGGDGELRSLRDERLDRRDAQHHGVPYDIVHFVALEDRLHEREMDARFARRIDARHELHANVAAGRADHTRHELAPPSVEHRDRVPGADAKNTPQVFRFLLRQHRRLVAGIDLRSEKPVHGRIIRVRSARCEVRG